MSLRSAYNHGLKLVTEILGGDSESRKAVDLLLRHCKEGLIPTSELDTETALLLEHFRLALPIGAIYDSLSWSMRIFTLSDMEIPYIVRYFFEDLKSGIFDWRKTVERYFRDIGEKRPHEFAEIFEEIVGRSRNLIICGEDIVDISMKYGRDGGVIIAEIKGAGLISPTVGCGKFGRARAPLYEINRFFYELVQHF